MATVLQVNTLHPDIQERLDRTHAVIQADLAALDDAWLAEHAHKIEGMVTGGHQGIPNALMQALPNLKVVAIHGVGFDKVDLDMARSRGVRVSNTPDVLTEDVADLAIGLTISLLRQLPQAHAHVVAGRWRQGDVALARKLSGKRIGIFGLGRIGREVAKRFGGFTDKIAYSDIVQHDVPLTYHADLEELAGASDVLVICAAATESTRRIVSKAVIEALGPQGVLVNVARGSIVDEAALSAALRDGTLGGAALDVFEDEPNVPDALLNLGNVVLTPHIASATHETRQAMGNLMLDNLDAALAGEPMPTPLV